MDKAAGVKLLGNEVLYFKEKPGEKSGAWDAISKFLFVLDCSMMNHLEQVHESKRGEREAQEAIRKTVEKLRPGRKPIGIFVQRYLHLTDAEDLIKIHDHYLHEHKPFSIHPEAHVAPGVEILDPVMIEKGAVIGEGSKIGPSVYIGSGSRIGRNVQLERCIVYPHCHIKEGDTRKDQVIVPPKD